MKKDTFVFLAFLVLGVVWVFHIPYSFTPNIVEKYSLDSDIFLFALRDIILFMIFLVCLFVVVGKRFLDSKWQQYRLYRICAVFAANIAFMFAWLVDFAVSVGFHCRYYWSIDCAHDPENSACQKFPIELDIAYLLYALPMLFMLCLILYYAFHYKILSKINCIGLTILLAINLISILICFRGNGIGCYD